MKLAIIGSRSILKLWGKIPKCTVIVSGGAKGVDTLAEEYAKENSITTEIIKPNYKKFGRGATHIRNREIVNKVDFVLFFWDGKSTGTKSVIKYAEKKNKAHEIRQT